MSAAISEESKLIIAELRGDVSRQLQTSGWVTRTEFNAAVAALQSTDYSFRVLVKKLSLFSHHQLCTTTMTIMTTGIMTTTNSNSDSISNNKHNISIDNNKSNERKYNKTTTTT